MITLRYVSLPPGLNAVARRSPNGDLEVFVSTGLTPAQQRTAARAAVRAFRSRRWAGVLPAPLAGVAPLLRKTGHAARAHGATAAVVTTLVAGAAGAFVALAPHAGAPLTAGGAPVPGQVHASAPGSAPPAATHPGSRPAGTHRSGTGRERRSPGRVPVVISAPGHGTTPGSSASPPTASSSGPGTSASAAPSATATPTPAPSSPSPGTHGKGCISLLVVHLCL